MEAIEKFVIDFDLEGLKNSDMVSSAVIRKFEVIGEATKNIPEDITKKYPRSPGKDGGDERQADPFLFWH